MEKQHTLKDSAFLSGIALHSGVRATVRILPAEEDSGIIFRRVDIAGQPEVKALATNVVDVRRGTTISNGQATVFTVEHILSALHACGIDNALVEMNGVEPPIVDGSALAFYDMVERAGRREQKAEAKFFIPEKILHVKENDTELLIMPAEAGDEFSIACTTSFAGCPFDPQFFSTKITAESFKKELAGARTFVNYRDLQMLFSMGLCKGGSLDSASIIHDGAIICKDSLRYPNEIVRHKMLDVVGDLFLCGRRVRGHVVAIKPGHPNNVKLAALMIQEMSREV